MIIPAVMLITFLLFVNHPIILLLLPAEIHEKISKGNAIPTPNKMKFHKFPKKLMTDDVNAKSTINEAGLQGRTIAPKNNPKINAER